MDGVARNTVTGNSATRRKLKRTIPWWPRVTRPRTVYCRPCMDGKQHDRQTSTQASAVGDGSSIPSMGLQDVNSHSRKDNLQFAFNKSPQSDGASSSSSTPADRNSLSLELTLATNFGNPPASLDPASFNQVEVNEAGESNYGLRISKEGDLLLFGKKIKIPTIKKAVIDENRGDNQMLSLSLGLGSNKDQNVLSQDSSYIKGDGHLFSLYPSYNNVPENNALFAPNYHQSYSGVPPLKPAYAMEGPNFASSPASEANTVSHPPGKTRKPRSDNFPSNVKTLLSTGVFEGVVVKYASLAHNKTIRGYIDKTGYRCTCTKCEGKMETLSAYEFEKHAGCRTKHPNTRIYFPNGKSIYEAVQELQVTPFATLVEVMKNITGGSIHERNFAIWKEKFMKARLELERIEGK